MAKVVDRTHALTGCPSFICDYSPPRSGRPEDVPEPPVGADFVSAAYNPGRIVRLNSVATAAVLRDRFATDPIFTMATRDMNRLALESLLLGAQALGLENVIVVAGDPFGPRDIASAVNDYRPTELIASIASLNSGVDHRGRPLRAPTNFCIGATVDLGRGVEPEAELAARKVEAGAQFLITQPIFEPSEINHLTEAITLSTGSPPGIPIFYGVGLMEPDGVSFAAVPEQIRSDLKAGRSGVDIALEVWEGLRYVGADDCYVVPPIRRSGARNYDAAREFLRQASA